jgi:hypothetical protein
VSDDAAEAGSPDPPATATEVAAPDGASPTGDAPTDPAGDAPTNDAAPDRPAPPRRPPVWMLVVIGVTAGALIGLAATALTRPGGDDEPSTLTLAPVDTGVPADHQANARAFILAWQKYRQSTFRVELTFERTLADGRSLKTERVMVQQPPRRVVRQTGSVSAIEGGATVSCDTVEDQTVCTPSTTADYDRLVNDELVAWATAFAGATPTYIVEAPEPGCYGLRLVRPLVAAPYGSTARFCFDAASGALRSREVDRDTATDTEEATRISTTVTDADFAAVTGG